MITPVYAYESAPAAYAAAIFLVGPTPRTAEDASWRPQVLHLIEAFNQETTIDLVIFIPEPRAGGQYTDYLAQVTWEKQQLERADAILAWVPRDMNTSLKGLTTNVEFGKYIDSDKLFYGRPPEADHIKYLDWLYTDITSRQPATTLATLVQNVLDYLKTQLSHCDIAKIRSVGERAIPLSVWATPAFQSWYHCQFQAGNRIVDARLLWLFTVPKYPCAFSYALHIDVWIAAEDRVKSNEFILSRPDIATVIPYWRHPTDPLASEVVLIKEFRSPARTSDGFVHELPGGSSFQGKGEPLALASAELQEETSLWIDPDRFVYLGTKQLAATWSTHCADVYAVALEEQEMAQAKQLAASGKTFGVAEDTEKTYVEVCTLREACAYIDWSTEGMIYRAIFSGDSKLGC